MRTTFTKSLVILFLTSISSLVAVQESKAQDVGEIISAGIDDANTYLENYFAPGINAFGNGLAGGWYNTAQAHKTLGVDLTLSLNLASIPDAEKLFSFSEAGFNRFQLRGDADGQLPTFAGNAADDGSELFIEAGTTIEYGDQSILIEDEIAFDVPGGIFSGSDLPVNISSMPAPTINLGIGIVKNTDLKLRLVPEQTFGDFSFKLFGIGVMHDIKQWIPGMKALPFDMSAFVGTTRLSASLGLTANSVETNTTTGTTTSFVGEGNAEFVTNATTVQVLVSKKLAIFTPYVGLGFNAVKSSFDVKGDFDYDIRNSNNSSQDQHLDIVDPISLQFTGAGGPRATIGGRLKLAVITLHADYTIQRFNTFSFGMGISVR